MIESHRCSKEVSLLGIRKMPETPLTSRVRKLILENIPSVLQLEILLHLYAERPRFLSISEMTRPLAIEAVPLMNQLVNLERRGLVSTCPTSADSFAYVSAQKDQDEAMRELVEAYRTHRVSVISLIYTRPADNLRAFADAFRLRKDDKE